MLVRLIGMGVAAVGVYGLLKLTKKMVVKANPDLKESYTDYKQALKDAEKRAFENEELTEKTRKFNDELEKTLDNLKDMGAKAAKGFIKHSDEDDDDYECPCCNCEEANCCSCDHDECEHEECVDFEICPLSTDNCEGCPCDCNPDSPIDPEDLAEILAAEEDEFDVEDIDIEDGEYDFDIDEEPIDEEYEFIDEEEDDFGADECEFIEDPESDIVSEINGEPIESAVNESIIDGLRKQIDQTLGE